MSMINSTVEIKNGKVVFSEEVLEYFENLRNEENSEWIDKYFKVLNDASNLGAEKYNLHHIRPCCTFKDDKHKKRNETQSLGDKFKGNIIKLSIYNHVKAHYFLWKIFNDLDSKCSIMYLCGLKTNIDNLSEDELNKIALIREECAKTNQTEEERKERERNYNKSDKRKKVSKNYYECHKNEESYIKSQEKYYNSEKAKQRREELNKRRYFDPKTENYYSHRNIIWRLKEFPQMYENMTINDFRCISIEDDEYKNWKKQKEEESLINKKNWLKNWNNKNREKRNKQERERRAKNRERDSELKKKLRNRSCYDPIKEEFCTYGQLENRIRRHKEDYKNVIIKNCLI